MIKITDQITTWANMGRFVYYDDKGSIFVGKSDIDNFEKIWLSCLFVKDEYRHRGIAHQLMDAAITLSKNVGFKEIWLICKKPLVTFYQNFGFTIYAINFDENGLTYTMVLEN